MNRHAEGLRERIPALVAVEITYMGYFFQASFGQFILICLVHSPCLLYLRTLSYVCTHPLAKMDATKCPKGSYHSLWISKERFCMHVVRAIS